MTQALFDTASIRGWMLGVSSVMGWLAIVAVLVVGAVDVNAGERERRRGGGRGHRLPAANRAGAPPRPLL